TMRSMVMQVTSAAVAVGILGCAESPPPTAPAGPSFATGRHGLSLFVIDVSRDTAAQDETPIAVNPRNANNILTGANDFNLNDGGLTWADGVHQKPVQVSAWNGNGKSRGGNGQFPDHDAMTVDDNPGSPFYGSVYVTWVQFSGLQGTHSPVLVAFSRDQARS